VPAVVINCIFTAYAVAEPHNPPAKIAVSENTRIHHGNADLLWLCVSVCGGYTITSKIVHIKSLIDFLTPILYNDT
jgi:hypothetical protein